MYTLSELKVFSIPTNEGNEERGGRINNMMSGRFKYITGEKNEGRGDQDSGNGGGFKGAGSGAGCQVPTT